MGLIDSTATVAGRLVTMRPVSREDYPALFTWRSSFDTVHMLNFQRRIASFEEFVREIESILANGILLLVREAAGGRPIGYAVAHRINPWDGWASVGLYVEPAYRMRGHGGETALLCIDALFRLYPLKKIMTEVYDFAEPQLAMVRAMGFEEVGYLADHYWYEDRFWGLYGMVLTRDRWNEYRDRFVDILVVQQRYEEMQSLRQADGA